MNNDFDAFADQLINQHQQAGGGGNNNNNGNRYQGIGGGNRRAAGAVNATLLNTAPRRSVVFQTPADTHTATTGMQGGIAPARRPLTLLGAWSASGTKAGATIAHVSALCALVRVATVQLGVANFTIPSIVRVVMPPPFSGALSLLSGASSHHRPTPTTSSIDDLSMVMVYVVLVWRCFGGLERRWGSSRFWAYLFGLHLTSLVVAGLNSVVTGATLSSSLVGAMWAVPLVGVVASGVRAVFPSLFSMGPRRQQQPTDVTTGNKPAYSAPTTPLFTTQRVQQLVPAAATAVLLAFNLPLVPMVLFAGAGVAAARWLSPNGVALMAMRRRTTTTITPQQRRGGILRSIQALLYIRLAQRTLAPFLRRVLHNLPTPSHPSQALPTTPVRVSTATCIQELGYNSQGTVMTEEEEMLYAAQRSGLAVIRPNGGGGAVPPQPPQTQQQQQPPRRSRSPQRQPSTSAQAQPTANINPTRGGAAAASASSGGQGGGGGGADEGLTPGQQSAIASVLAIGLPDVTEESAKNALFVSGWSVDAAVMLLLDNPGGI